MLLTKQRFGENLERPGRKYIFTHPRLEVFSWIVDVRYSLKARLPRAIFTKKCQEMHEDYLKRNNINLLEDEKLKFSSHWIADWRKDLG